MSYDVIIPSDYMIARLQEEGMLRPLNFDNIPNYEYIGEDFRGLYYDPEERYTVPYTYGVVGVIYNANKDSIKNPNDLRVGQVLVIPAA